MRSHEIQRCSGEGVTGVTGASASFLRGRAGVSDNGNPGDGCDTRREVSHDRSARPDRPSPTCGGSRGMRRRSQPSPTAEKAQSYKGSERVDPAIDPT